ncbi:unannotated protein [freshwater metagenome]|uniref:Unannotated protein n=1 Tax=freshwater metagenome TaxID=449393 RepID=A0A6J7HZH2_9ZZZZ
MVVRPDRTCPTHAHLLLPKDTSTTSTSLAVALSPAKIMIGRCESATPPRTTETGRVGAT